MKHFFRGGRVLSIPYILSIIFCVLFSNVFAQPRGKLGTAVKAAQGEPDLRIAIPVSGVILDDATGQPFAKLEGKKLPTVVIMPADVFVGVDDKGEFSFKTVFASKGYLKAYREGYELIEIPFDLENRGPFTIRLKALKDTVSSRDTVQAIEEVTVVETGYFRVPQERATGSFVHIDNELLSRSVGSNILDRLNGVTRGLIFNQRSMGASIINGQPSMSIRGVSTLHANKEPLIILDNFPFEGDIDNINPDDIESVTVLQDAAAASIWGARAGNGVIVLTSKKGRFEQPLKVSVRSDVSISEKPNLYYNPTIPMDEFIEIERFLYGEGVWDGAINQVYPYITPTIEALLAHKNGHISEAEMEARIAQLKTQDVRRDLNKYVYRPVQLYKGAVNFRGGAKQHNYYFSAGYDKNLGDISGYDDTRVTLQARNSYRMLNNKLTFDTHLQFTSSRNRNAGGALFQVLYDKLADNQGNPLSIGGGYSSTGLRQSYIDTAGNGLLQDWNYYPLDNIHQINVVNSKTAYQIHPSINYRPLDWLNVGANYQYVRQYNETNTLREASYFDIRDLYNKYSEINYATNSVTHSLSQGDVFNQSNQGLAAHFFRASFDVDKHFGSDHQINFVGGIEVNSRNTLDREFPVMIGYQPETETYTPFDLDGVYPYYLTKGTRLFSGLSPQYATRRTTINRNRLYFTNASYTYDRRYTATFSARKDEANIFGVDINKRGRPFWSAGLRWQLHEEEFYKVDWLSKLALRATHGYTGNVSSASAYITSTVASRVDVDTKRPYQTITNPPNPQLSWENVVITNIALDFSALNNRLSGSVEHYRKKATDLLSSQPINPSSGVTSLFGNWSSLRGWGWDLNLSSRNIVAENFSWKSDLILSYTNEKVTDYKLKPSSDLNYLTSNLGQYPIEGKPLYGIYSLASAGLDANGQPQGYLNGVISQDYSNIYNNTRLDDYIYHGRATPPLFGSIRNTFQYKALELSVNISAQFGYYIRRSGMNYGALYSTQSYTWSPFQYDYLNRWQQSGDELKTHVPVATYPVVNNRESFYAMSEHLVEQGDYIRLRDIRLGYKLKLPQIGIPLLQVYGYANNLGVLWAANNLGFDPEAVYRNSINYPAVRSYSLGVNINF